MRSVLFNFLLLTGVIFTGFLAAQPKAYTPKEGTAERKMLLDTLRFPVQQEIKTAVLFKVDRLRVQDGWAFMRGVPLQPSGKPVDYKGTRYQAAIEQGLFDDWICALLQKQQGQWKVIQYEIGATDVPYIGWDKRYRAPAEIFK